MSVQKMHLKSMIGLAAIVGLSLQLSFDAHSQDTPAQRDQAYVAKLSTSCTSITLTRGETVQDLRLMDTVLNNDTINAECKKANGDHLLAELSFSDGSSKSINIGDAPYQVAHEFNHQSIVGNMWAWTRAALGLASDAKPVRLTGTHGKGGGDIAAPWANAVASVMADRKSLALYWLGGKAPYAITVRDTENNIIHTQENLTVAHTIIPFPPTKQQISVEISSATGQTLNGTIERMNDDDWKALQKSIAGDLDKSFPPELLAVAMMTEVEGRLLLEAYQQVSTKSDTADSATSLVKEMMEFGDLPDLVRPEG